MAKSRRRAADRGISLRKRDGRSTYTARISVQGRRYEFATGESNREAAIRAAREKKAEVERTEVYPDKPLLRECERWINSLKGQKSEPYIDQLEIYTVHWIDFGWTSLRDINSREVERYILARREAKKKNVTIRKELSGLRLFLRYCKRHGLIGKLPEWETPPKDSDYKALCLTPLQIKEIFSHLSTAHDKNSRGPAREYYSLAWETGLRAGTLRRIRWSDVDIEQGLLHIRRSADKSRYERTVPLSPGAIKILKSLPRDGELVFGIREFRKQLKKAAKDAEMPPEVVKQIGCHTFRHSRATYWASQPGVTTAAMQHLLGHKDLHSTNVYMHGSLESAKKVVKK